MSLSSVSYTHLDVYKRQLCAHPPTSGWLYILKSYTDSKFYLSFILHIYVCICYIVTFHSFIVKRFTFHLFSSKRGGTYNRISPRFHCFKIPNKKNYPSRPSRAPVVGIAPGVCTEYVYVCRVLSHYADTLLLKMGNLLL